MTINDERRSFNQLLSNYHFRAEIPKQPSYLGSSFSKFTSWRPQQDVILDKLLHSNQKFILFEAPTGSGKTLVSTAIHKLLKLTGTVYCPTTKRLQDQYTSDFGEFSIDLRGRANYPCLQPGIKSAAGCIEVKDEPCEFKDSCSYRNQVEEARFAELAVVNIWSLLYQTHYAGRFTNSSSRKDEPHRYLLVLDEADALENVLIGFSSRDISEKSVKKYYLPRADFSTVDINYWLEWLEKALNSIEDVIQKAPTKEEKNELTSFKANTLLGLKEDLSDSWVAEPTLNGIHLTPTDISSLAHKYLFKHFDRILLMSATLGNVFPETIGISEYDYFNLPSYFPVHKRPIYYIPCGDITSRQEELVFPNVVEAIDKILGVFKGEQAIIHTVSEARAEKLQSLSKHEIVIYSSQNGALLDLFLDKTYRAIASPSLVRGFDFPDDTCRINIITKVPYPSLGSKSVQVRLEKSQKWYNWQAVRDLVQMTGRSTRSTEDYSLTFILDSQFEKLLTRSRDLFPKWWLDALVKTDKISYSMLREASK